MLFRSRRFARDEVQIVACLCAAVEFYRLVLFDGEILSFKDVVLAFAHDVHDRAARRNIRNFALVSQRKGNRRPVNIFGRHAPKTKNEVRRSTSLPLGGCAFGIIFR